MPSLLNLLFPRPFLPFMSNPLFLKRRTRASPNPHLLVAQQRTLGLNALSNNKYSQPHLPTTNGISLSKYSFKPPDKKPDPSPHPQQLYKKDTKHTTKTTFANYFKQQQPKILFEKPQLASWSAYFNPDKKTPKPDSTKTLKQNSLPNKPESKEPTTNGTTQNIPTGKQNKTEKKNHENGKENKLIGNPILTATPQPQIQPQTATGTPGETHKSTLISFQQTSQTTIAQPQQKQIGLQMQSQNSKTPNKNQNNKENIPTPNKNTPNPPQRTLNLVGLNNIGNTCYMNSILQCLLNLPHFNDRLLELKPSDLPSSSKIASAYLKFASLMRSSPKSSENPAELKLALSTKKPRFSGYSQQDAQQFLTALLQCLSTDLNRSKHPTYKQLTADLSKHTLEQIGQQWWNYNKQREDSIVTDFFTGQLLSKAICSKCKNQSIAFDNTWQYPLHFPNSETVPLHKLIAHFLKEQTISKDYYCSKCKTFQQCQRTLSFHRLPPILVLQLKRFAYGKYSKHKINTKVIVEQEIDLNKFITNYNNTQGPQLQYQLVGVVHHNGDIDFGHYTAECRHPANGKWYSYNDSQVREINMDPSFQSSSPYLLFYSKKT